MSSDLYLKIDSQQRMNYATTNPGSFNIVLQRPLEGSWRLCQAYVPVSQYNVNSTNNVINFFENNVSKTATLTQGYHDTNTLMAEVAAQMTAASGGFAIFTVTQSSLPLRITISSTQNFRLQFGSYKTNSAASIIGYLPVDTAIATSHLAANIANLVTQRSYNISINNESRFIDSTGRLCSFVVPVLSNSGGLAVYEPSIIFPQIITFTQPTSTLKIQVTDDTGNIIGLSCDFYLLLGKC